MTSKSKKKKRSYWWLWFLAGAAVCLLMINHQIFDPVKEPVWKFLNSNFSTAFFGAVGGSLTIILIEWFRRQRQVLADINASIGVLASLSNTLLNMKQQHIVPLATNYQQNVNKLQTMQALRRINPNPPEPVVVSFDMYLKRFHCPELHFDIPMDRIFTLTDRVPQIVPIITQTKRSVGEVENICHVWNGMVDMIKNMPEEEKKAFYFGGRSSPDIVDTYFPDTVHNLVLATDDGLFFINRSIQSLTKLGNRTLPFWLRSKIARSEIISQEHKDLMPPENYKEGWGDE